MRNSRQMTLTLRRGRARLCAWRAPCSRIASTGERWRLIAAYFAHDCEGCRYADRKFRIVCCGCMFEGQERSDVIT